MPASNKPVYTDSRWPDPEEPQDVPEPDIIPLRAGKRKTKNAAARQLANLDHAENTQESASMGQSIPPASSNPPSSILGQLPQPFPQNRTSNTFDALNGASPSQKVFDEYTHPIEPWAHNPARGRTSAAEQMTSLIAGTPPQYEPGFSTRAPFNSRSPPISPPMRNARPVSFSGGVPTVPNPHRLSTSPYGYGVTAYGSPPALPHLPQQHFYGAQDVDLGLRSARTPLPEPVPLKFAHFPGSGSDFREAILVTIDGELQVVGYNGEKLEHIGGLGGLPGTIIDAALLTWSAGDDPFLGLRPLIALIVHGPCDSELRSPPHEDHAFSRSTSQGLETKVIVFSLSKSCQVVELLRAPAATNIYPGMGTGMTPAAKLKVHASGSFVTVSSADSGEVFVFAPRQSKDSAVFECLAKYWTTLQPHLPGRDSSHGRRSDSDVSPADLGRGLDVSPPVFSLCGRWLAFCPANTSSQRSIGAALGDFVLYNKSSSINSGVAPARPLVNCEVDSPDVETFLGKVAKGFAQEAVRGAKWIGEKGMQTWQSYWKKDTGTPSPPPLPSSSPPVYPPHLGMAQFPPTYAIEQQDISRDPELVAIVDLKLLQDHQGRKLPDATPMITFQPPGGCSFLSLTPAGLSLLTASRKGDVQYVWDLMQMKYAKASTMSSSNEGGRVRQIARYERLSPSAIVDVAWDGPNAYRFALLTRNRTIHIFDLPKTAFTWPPPVAKRSRPTSAPVDPAQVKTEHDPAPSGGFLASAMSIAGRTQPMLASLRGRAPSMSSGLAGVAPAGIGFASTATIKSGGRAVAAGLSKSLGAASETVTNIRHANQSRLHLRIPARAGMFCWLRREGKSVLSILDETNVKNYYVRMTKPREQRQIETVSVFDARKAVSVKLPKAAELAATRTPQDVPAESDDTDHEAAILPGFWKPKIVRETGSRTPHPLASAEIETNAPYQPFHSDRRVLISFLATEAASIHFQPTMRQGRAAIQDGPDKWVFGSDISFTNQILARSSRREPILDAGSHLQPEPTSAPILPEPAPIHSLDDDIPQLFTTITTKKKKGKKNRPQPLLAEEDEAAEAGRSYTAHAVPFESDEDPPVGGDFPEPLPSWSEEP